MQTKQNMVDKAGEFYCRSMKWWLEKNDIEMYSTHNEGKSVVTERLIKTLKNKIYKYMTSISKNVYVDKLDDIVNKYKNTYHCTIKMKPVDVKPSTYIDIKLIIKILNLKLVILLEYQNIKNFLQVVMLRIGLKNFSWLKKLKALFCQHMLLVILKTKKLLEVFTKKNCKKQIKKSLVLKKIINRKDDKLYVKWKGCDSSFKSWIDKKGIV